MPVELIKQRYFTQLSAKPGFTANSSLFEDLVVSCVRYAFSNIPANVGRVFFSKHVAMPFLRWRMLRHGYWKSPVHWRECELNKVWNSNRHRKLTRRED